MDVVLSKCLSPTLSSDGVPKFRRNYGIHTSEVCSDPYHRAYNEIGDGAVLSSKVQDGRNMHKEVWSEEIHLSLILPFFGQNQTHLH